MSGRMLRGFGMECAERAKGKKMAWRWSLNCCVGLALLVGVYAGAQENPLGDVHTQAPPAPTAPKDERPVITGSDEIAKRATSAPGSNIHVDVNLVLVPATVTDPMNRLVTGLERENFYLTDNNVAQKIKTFATQDAPLTIGIVFDLS